MWKRFFKKIEKFFAGGRFFRFFFGKIRPGNEKYGMKSGKKFRRKMNFRSRCRPDFLAGRRSFLSSGSALLRHDEQEFLPDGIWNYNLNSC
jgi:hypothetical protein